MQKRMWLSLGLSLCTCVAVAAAKDKEPNLPKAPQGFDITMYAQPPQVNYPVCITTSPAGELFVGSDPQGSLGKKPNQGHIIRCIDTNNDGVADKFNDFVQVDHPRGLIYDHHTLWVLHPPTLTVYFDDNGDGKADRSKVLIKGISTEYVNKRGADHTTNGIRMGIDGWIYIAMGDFGCYEATGTDGKKLTHLGGGVVRVRPDGTEIEVYAYGTRNILDPCIDPEMNVFVRDNTNDGGGWDVRLMHLIQSGNYGYPMLFKHFTDETLSPLADYGGGSGTGGMFVAEGAMPKPYDRMLLTSDWGRSYVYAHPRTVDGPTFKIDQQEFLQIPRPTDVDCDGSGRLYVSSWNNGGFSYKGVDVGYVVELRPKGSHPKPTPDIEHATDAQLLQYLAGDSAFLRQHAQLEILRRGDKFPQHDVLALAENKGQSLDARVAAIFTLKQLAGAGANPMLAKLAEDDATVREWALRAMTDRLTQLEGAPASLYEKYLSDPNPRVQIAAAVGIGRLGDKAAAPKLIAMSDLPASEKPKLAAKQKAAFESKTVSNGEPVSVHVDLHGAKKLYLVVTDGGDGNGLDHSAWLNPKLNGPSGSTWLSDRNWFRGEAGWGAVHKNADCQGHPMKVGGQTYVHCIGTHAPSVIGYDLPAGCTSFDATAAVDDGAGAKGKGSVKFEVYVDDLPSFMQDVGKPVYPAVDRVVPHIAVQALIATHAVGACLDAIDGPHRDGALWALRWMHDPKVVDGLIDHLHSSSDPAMKQAVLTALIRLHDEETPFTGTTWWSTRPDTHGPYYNGRAWAQTPKIDAAIREAVAKAEPETLAVIDEQLRRDRVTVAGLNLGKDSGGKSDDKPQVDLSAVVKKGEHAGAGTIGKMKFEDVVADVQKIKGNAKHGEMLFTQQGCVVCHTLREDQAPKGPFLGDIAARYSRAELAESIVHPSARIAQGFDTHWYKLKNGTQVVGFQTRDAGNEVDVRAITGITTTIKKDQIVDQGVMKQSTMPEGLVANLKPHDLASIMAYFESLLKKK